MVNAQKKKREGGKYLVSGGDDERRRKWRKTLGKGERGRMEEKEGKFLGKGGIVADGQTGGGISKAHL